MLVSVRVRAGRAKANMAGNHFNKTQNNRVNLFQVQANLVKSSFINFINPVKPWTHPGPVIWLPYWIFTGSPKPEVTRKLKKKTCMYQPTWPRAEVGNQRMRITKNIYVYKMN